MRSIRLLAVLCFAACGGAAENDAAPAVADTSTAALQAELLAMGEADQAARGSLTIATAADTALLARIARTDSANMLRLAELVEQHGWPERSRVGDAAAGAAFLIVQHSPSPEFQKRMLELLRESAERGEADLGDVAMLTDRVLVHEGRPQLYGTQFHIEEGRLVPYPIADLEGLEAARRTMGLMPMTEYVQALRATFDGPVEWATAVSDSAADTAAATR